MAFFSGKNLTNNSRGFTIMEVLAVIALMLCVIVPAAAVITRSLEASNEEHYLSHAAFLAQLKIEEVRAKSSCYSQNPGCPDSGGTADFNQNYTQNSAACFFEAPFQQYECTVDTAMVAGTGNSLKVIQVRVWYDKNVDGTRNANEPQVFLETQIGRRTPYY